MIDADDFLKMTFKELKAKTMKDHEHYYLLNHFAACQRHTMLGCYQDDF